jgi:hypothetical protein
LDTCRPHRPLFLPPMASQEFRSRNPPRNTRARTDPPINGVSHRVGVLPPKTLICSVDPDPLTIYLQAHQYGGWEDEEARRSSSPVSNASSRSRSPRARCATAEFFAPEPGSARKRTRQPLRSRYCVQRFQSGSDAEESQPMPHPNHGTNCPHQQNSPKNTPSPSTHTST